MLPPLAVMESLLFQILLLGVVLLTFALVTGFAFVEDLHRQVLVVEKAKTWPQKCAAATQLLYSLLGTEGTHSSWPEHDQEAFGRVEESLTRLAALDSIEPSPTHAVFQRALRTELDVARGRHGRFGHGAVYGPIATAVGHDLDAVFVLGASFMGL